MRVYRYLDENEFKHIVQGDTENIGSFFANQSANTHRYKENVRYLHFFKNLNDFQYIQNLKESTKMYLCEFDIPLKILFTHFGIGYYVPSGYDCDYNSIYEFAIPSKLFNSSFLRSYAIDEGRKLNKEKILSTLEDNRVKTKKLLEHNEKQM